MDWQPSTPLGSSGTASKHHAFAALALLIALPLASMTAVTMMDTASASSSVDVGSLSTTDVDRTLEGNLSDVRASADLSYQYSVPDAERRLIKLQVGPSTDALETVTYLYERDPPNSDSGSVTLTASLFEADSLRASEFQPAPGETTTREITVRAIIEVQRPDGEPVRNTVTEDATITFHKNGSATVSVGGTVEFTVETTE